MEHYVKHDRFPDNHVPLPRRYFNLVTFGIHNVVVAFLFVLLAKLCGISVGLSVLLLLGISGKSLFHKTLILNYEKVLGFILNNYPCIYLLYIYLFIYVFIYSFCV